MRKALFLALLVASLWSVSGVSALACGTCFEDTAPFVQVNGYPEVDWGAVAGNPLAACPSCACGDPMCNCVNASTYAVPLRLTFGFVDSCQRNADDPQLVCGEFFIVAADEGFRTFAYLTSDLKWHFTQSISEIRPYRTAQEPGESPLVVHYNFPEGLDLPAGLYHLIAFGDSVFDGRPTLEVGKYRYCVVHMRK